LEHWLLSTIFFYALIHNSFAQHYGITLPKGLNLSAKPEPV